MIRLEALKKASCARHAESTQASLEAVKPSKATRAVHGIAENLSLESLKEDFMRQINDLRTEKQRRIDELEAENQRLRQKDEVKLVEPATTKESKKDYSNTICFTYGQNDHTSIV